VTGTRGEAADRTRFRFQLVGDFVVSRNGARVPNHDIASRKGRTLLKVLLVHADEPVSLDQLQAILWPDGPPGNASRNVASLVSRLRARFGADMIEGGAGTYRFRPGPGVEVDLLEAERLVAEARSRLSAEEPALAAVAAARGLEFVAGDTLLAEEPDSDWAEPARARHGRIRRDLRRSACDAALALDDPTTAITLTTASLEEDPLDEDAARAKMRAHHAAGQTAEALRVYERLRAALAEELGVDPSAQTRGLHVALLREHGVTEDRGNGVQVAPPATPRSTAARRDRRLVGREAELTWLRQRWDAAAGGQTTSVLILGEAGIGKTRLAQELAALTEDTGARVLSGRCYEAERSLFLGPVVELVSTLVHQTAPERLRATIEPWGGTLARLLPELDTVLGPFERELTSPDVERRRTFQALTALFQRLADEQPVTLLLDDLHNAGAATVEFLHFLLRHLRRSRLLVLATCRVEEGSEVVGELADITERLELGPLPDTAVATLARRFGAEDQGAQILAATRGHTLSVMEMLNALAEAGDEPDQLPVPRSLRDAVQQRLDRVGGDVAELLRGAATLGSTFDLTLAAQLLALPVEDAVRRSERALHARLLVEDGTRLSFTNDLIHEILYETTPRPLRVTRHQLAATLFPDNPEANAQHASAAEDWATAWPAWLEAGQRAARRYANRDAVQLLTRAVDTATEADDAAGVARARLARAIAREALADFGGELEDLEAARELARTHGHPDLEAAALRQLGGDVLVGLGRPTTDCLPYLEAGLEVARSARLGRIEVELQGRIAVIWSNRLRFDRAAEAADAALERAQQLADDAALAFALDAVKNVSAYTGDLDRLETVVPELEQLLTRQPDPSLRQYLPWTVFEGAIGPLARGEWDHALTRLDAAIELSRRTGHPWRSLFLAHRSWLHRQQGFYGAALADTHIASDQEVSAGHPWWSAFTAAMQGWLLSDLGQDEEAVRVLEAGVAATAQDGMESYLLRCVSHLALARWRADDPVGAERDLARAEALLDAVSAPPGGAFLHGAHAYAAVARVHVARGDVDAGRRHLDILNAPAARVGWREIVATDRVLRARVHVLEGDLNGARHLLSEGASVAEDAGLRPLAWEAHITAAPLAEDDTARSSHERAAADHLDAMVASLDDEALRTGLRVAAARRVDEAADHPSP
jgi:DNA-binding SARP family transcriptional activator/tetratricopeptide (TPR) repeat protein